MKNQNEAVQENVKIKPEIAVVALQQQDSPHSDVLKNHNANFNSKMMKHSSPSDQIAGIIILQAITSPEPKLRYPIGQDAVPWLEKKNKMTDDQFQEYISISAMSIAPSQRSSLQSFR